MAGSWSHSDKPWKEDYPGRESAAKSTCEAFLVRRFVTVQLVAAAAHEHLFEYFEQFNSNDRDELLNFPTEKR